MRTGSLRHLVVRLGLDGMHEVGELHGVLDEEHRDVVAHQIPVAFVGVELHGKAAHIACRVLGATLAGHGGKANKHRRHLAGLLEWCRLGVLRQRCVAFKIPVRAGATRMHDAFRNALMVEVGDLFPQNEIFEQRRPPQAEFQRVLVVGDCHALVGRQRLARRIHPHAVQWLNGGVDAFGRYGSRFVAAVFFRQGAAGGKPRFRLDRGALPGCNCVCKSVLGRLGRIERHGSNQGFGLDYFFNMRVTA